MFRRFLHAFFFWRAASRGVHYFGAYQANRQLRRLTWRTTRRLYPRRRKG
jgi:hypothetical protein